jgi:hypothetical protein
VGTVADFAGGIGFGISAVETVISLLQPPENQMKIMLQAFQDLLNTVDDHVKAGFALDRLRQIDNAVAKSQSVLDTLKASIDAKAAGTPAGVEQVRTCREAVDDLSAQSAWLGVYFDDAYYDDNYRDFDNIPEYPFPSNGHLINIHPGWGPKKPTADADGFVFSHTAVLAAWIYAESVFLLAGSALDPEFREHYGATMASDADFLQSVHDRIVSGFQDLAPINWDVPDLATGLGFNQGASAILDGMTIVGSAILGGMTIIGTRVDYGEVSVYDGVTRMAQTEFLNNEVSPDGTFASNPAIYQKYYIRLMKQRKLMYSGLGLRPAAEMIRRLRSIGKPVPNYGDWSFKEICGVAGTHKLSDIKKLIQGTVPVTPSLGTNSFRVLLN